MSGVEQRYLATLADSATAATLASMGFDWGPADGNLCAALAFRRTVEDALPLVGLVGGASSGKSTLFNSLVGKEVSAISALPHETLGPVAAVHDDHWPSVAEWVQRRGLFPGRPVTPLNNGETSVGQTDSVVVYRHGVEEFRGVLVFDLPDVTSHQSATEGGIARTMLPWFDGVVVVVDEERWFDATVFEDVLARSGELGLRHWMVFNQTQGDGDPSAETRDLLVGLARERQAAGWCFSPYQPGRGFRPLADAVRRDVAAWLASPPPVPRRRALGRLLGRRAGALLSDNVRRAEQSRLMNGAVDRVIEESTAQATLSTDLLTAEERRLLGLGHRLVPLYAVYDQLRMRWGKRPASWSVDARVDFDKREQALAEVLRENLSQRWRHAAQRIQQAVSDAEYWTGLDESPAWSWEPPAVDAPQWAARIRGHLDAWKAEASSQARKSDAAALLLGVPLLVADLLFLGGAGLSLVGAAAWVGGLFGAKGVANLFQQSSAFKEYQDTVRLYQALLRDALSQQWAKQASLLPRRHLPMSDPIIQALVHWSGPGAA